MSAERSDACADLVTTNLTNGYTDRLCSTTKDVASIVPLRAPEGHATPNTRNPYLSTL